VDVHDKLDEVSAFVENARSMPMSASCIVHRGDLLGLLEEVRELLPEEFRHAQLLLTDREAVVEEGRREAARLVAEGEAERARLTSETGVHTEALRQAEQIRAAARDEAETMRGEVDDYVDTKLANFEVALDKTLAAVHRGREKLRERSPIEDWAHSGDDAGHPLDDHSPVDHSPADLPVDDVPFDDRPVRRS
jgi:vacuolar-type H+-ATPase subunit H